GTFIVNISGSLIYAACILLQSYKGINLIGCKVLQGVEDGLCGCLTTVSTWVVEITSLRRTYIYYWYSQIYRTKFDNRWKCIQIRRVKRYMRGSLLCAYFRNIRKYFYQRLKVLANYIIRSGAMG